MPDDWDFSTKRRSTPPLPIITFGLCALCVILTLVYLNAPEGSDLARIRPIIAPSSEQIWSGAYFGLLTTFFPHGGPVHLIFNMMWLWQLGREMEATLPPLQYFAFLAVAAMITAGCELAVMGQAGIGASGVVYAMFGLMWVGKARYQSWGAIANRQNLNVMLIWGVACIVTTAIGLMHVANVAHFSGLLFGLAVGWLWLAPRRKPIWAIPAILLSVLAALSLFWLPWSAEWYHYKGSKAFQSENYRLAITNYHRSLRLGGDRYFNWENINRAWYNLELDAKRRNDTAAIEEAKKQQESAERLEGPDPATQPQKSPIPTMPDFRRRSQGK